MKQHASRNGYASCIFILTLLYPICSIADSSPVLLKENGGWCWFQDERAIVDGDQLIFGSVSSPQGDVEVTSYNIKTKETQSFVLHKGLQSDDHNLPGLFQRDDGRYLAVYAKHGSDHLMRWRMSVEAGDISAWSDEQTIDVGAGNTYSNLLALAKDGLLLNFHRGIGWNPNYMVSNDQGKTWAYGGRLLKAEGRPYMKYAGNRDDTIHFTATDHHPHNFPNSIYHGFIRDGVVHHSNGDAIAPLSQSTETELSPSDLTVVFQGDENNIAWMSDIHLDENGHPCIVFSVRKNKDVRDHRYHYARWDGSAWKEYETAYAGTNLYERQLDYTGLAAIDPDDVTTVFISSNCDPKSGEPLISERDHKRHYEIFKGITRDGGENWKWEAVTQDSTTDQLRPIVPVWNKERTFLLWLSGEYRTYTDYDQNVMGLIIENE